MEIILFRTPTQVNAKGLLREVQAAKEGLEAGVQVLAVCFQQFCHYLLDTLC